MRKSTLSFFEPCSLINLQLICKTFLAGFMFFFATIANAQSTTETVTACDSYTWNRNNTTYIASGTYVIPPTLISSVNDDLTAWNQHATSVGATVSSNNLGGLSVVNMQVNLTVGTTAINMSIGNGGSMYATSSFVGSVTANQPLTMTFNPPVYGVIGNYYMTDANDNTMTANVTVNYSNGTSVNRTVNTSTDSFGIFSSTMISSVVIRSTQTNPQTWVSLNNLRLATISTNTLNLTINSNNTIALSSAAGSNAQTVCANSVINNITYDTTGATGATFSGLPAGVTGSWQANVATISGTPTSAVGSPYSYTVTLTGGCGTITANGTITVSPSSENTTPATACGSYTWANNAQTYTQSGQYTGTTTNCVTEKLNLTITPSTDNITIGTTCSTYTWSNNGQTYATSGQYTGTTTNCVTEKLNLTITPAPIGATLGAAIVVNATNYSTTGNNLSSNCYISTVGNASPEVWYKVNLDSCTATMSASTCAEDNYDTNLRIYDEDGITQLANNDDFCDLQSTISNLNVAGKSFVYIIVEGWSTSQGSYSLNIDQNFDALPTFAQVDPICMGGILNDLPTTSINNIVGTWSPVINNMQTTVYTFTPDDIQCMNTTTMTVTVNSNTDNITTDTACGSYTWANSGQTYTTSGIYDGTTTNCITAKLNLTITPSTDNVTTENVCGSYTWANNGQTYTTSGQYTGTTTNCITEKLNLTITPSTDNVTTENVCGSYTWANNGQTYTTSGIYDGTTTNCVTEKLNLTINAQPAAPALAGAGIEVTITGNCSNISGVYLNDGLLNGKNSYTLANSSFKISFDGVKWLHWFGSFSNTGFQNTTVTADLFPPTTGWIGTQCSGDNLTYTNMQASINFCTSATVAALTPAPSTTIKWYTAATGGVALATTDVLASGNYYVSETNASGCESLRTLLAVTVTPLSDSITNVTACTSYTWNGVTYTSSGLYTGPITNCVTQKLNLTLNSTPPVITVQPLPIIVCPGSPGSATIVATGTGLTYQWQYSYDFGSNVGGNAGEPGNNTNTISGITNVGSNLFFRCIVSNTNGCSVASNWTPTSQPQVTFYADADGDGFGDSMVTQTSCIQPAGFVLNNTDCDDANANKNPGKPEIAYNGIDDNCDGNLDEGFPAIISTLIGATCGSTLANSFLTIHANQVAGATGYRFKVTNMTTNSVQIIDRTPFFWFQFNTVNDLTYNTQYKIEVMVQRAGIFLGYYGAACFVNTPSTAGTGAKSSTLSPVSCGATLASINSSISANALSSVTGYRFRVTNTFDSSVQILDRTVQWFNMTMLPQRVYGQTYTVEVALKTTGSTYAPYGDICTITTPAVPTIQNVCGTQISKSYLNFGTRSMTGVTNYSFEVTNTVTNAVQTLTKMVHFFNFGELTGVAPATDYSIRVALKTAGVFSAYSAACIVKSPAASREVYAVDGTPESVTEDFKVLAMPNPFSNNFSIDMTSNVNDKVGIKIFDMIGKLIEAREVEFMDINTVSIGENYPSGVYNVIVNQGENVKTLRVIKR